MTLPPSLVSNTLASLYMKQGHQDVAIELLRELESRKRQRQSDFLTELLARVSIQRTERHSHGIQRKPRSHL
jgi:hypothetical protein